ncbi:unnamed protein product, partial [Iphiclides podalirius]
MEINVAKKRGKRGEGWEIISRGSRPGQVGLDDIHDSMEIEKVGLDDIRGNVGVHALEGFTPWTSLIFTTASDLMIFTTAWR